MPEATCRLTPFLWHERAIPARNTWCLLIISYLEGDANDVANVPEGRDLIKL